MIVVLVAGFSSGACSSRRDDGDLVKVEEHDPSPFGDSVWIGYRKNGNKHGQWIEIWDGKRNRIEHWRDGVKNGVAINLYENGQLHTDDYWRAGKPHGRSRMFGDDGQIWSLGWDVNGLQEGVWCEWDADGRLEAIEHWFRGRKEHTVAFPQGECPHVVGTGRRHLDPNDRDYR